MSAVIGALRGVLSLDSAAFETGAKRSKASMGDLERRLVGLGNRFESVGRKMTLGLTLPMAGAAAVAVKSSLKVIDAQAKMAQSFGTTVKSLQVLERAADLSGVSMGEVQQATIQLTKRLSQAAGGTGAAAKALSRLHLNAQELQRLPLDQRLAKIQAALSQYVPEAERAAVASELFGSRAGLIFTRIDGAALRAATEDVERFGVAVSEVDAEQIERTNDAISQLGLVGRGVSNQLAVGLAPTLEWLSNRAGDAAEWFNGLNDRTKQFLSVSVALTAAVGPAALGLGLLLKIAAPLGAALLGTVSAVALAPVKFALASKSAVALEMALGATSAKAALSSIAIKGLTRSLKLLRVAAMATGIGALVAVSAGIYQGFVQSREAAENYDAAIRGLASAHDVLNTATETFYANMTAKNAEAMRRAAEAARDATREALEAARAELEAASFYTNLFGASLYETDRMAKARSEIDRLGAALAEAEARLDAASVAAQRTASETGNAADRAGEAAENSNNLAGGLAAASGQASALSSYLASVPGALAAAQTNIAGLKAGMAVLSAGGGQAAANVAKYRAELEASAGPLGELQDGQRAHVQQTIEQQVQLYAQEQELRGEYQKQLAALNKVKAAGGAASKSALAGLQKELRDRRALLGMTESQRKKLEAVRLVQQRLGKEGGKLSKAQIEALADQVVELGEAEDALERVNDMQRQWSEQITRTAFEGGSLGDTITGMLKDIAYQFAHAQFVLPIVGKFTGFLGLDKLLLSGGSQSASGLLSGGGGGLMGGGGGLLGSAGNLVLGGSGFLSGVSSGLMGVLSGGGLGSSFANLGGLLSGASGFTGGALGAALPALGVIAAGVAVLVKGFSRKYEGSGLQGSFSADGLEQGYRYEKYSGGWFRSDKINLKSMDSSLKRSLDEAMKEAAGSVLEMADVLNLSTDGLKNMKDVSFRIWTSNKSDKEIQKYLEGKIKQTADQMAKLLLGTTEFNRAGESSLKTLERLSKSLVAVNGMMDLLGETAFEISAAGGDMASRLADHFGGLKKMGEAVNTYFSAFYTATEQAETLRRQALERLEEKFGDLGIAMPQSRQAFRDLVESLDLTTTGGRELYAELLSLSAAMDLVLPKVSLYTEAMQGLVDRIGGEIGLQIETARGMAADAKAAAQLWYRTANTLRDFLGGLVNSDLTAASSAQVLAVQRNRIQTAFELVQGGDVQAAQDIPELARAYLQSLKTGAASSLEYRRAAAQIQGQINFAAGIADLEGANDDILRGLYEQQIDVLTSLAQFLQLEGLTAEQVAELGEGVAALAEDWDGTVTAFETSLGALADAIENAEAFSYDDLVGRLDVAVSLDENAPAWLSRLVDQADTGIRTMLDFVIRRDDLTAADRWIATNSLSEHVAALDFVLREDLDDRIRRLVLRTTGELRRDLTLNLVQDLDPETRQMVLTRSASLSRRVNVALTNEGGRTLRQLNRLRDLIGTEGNGRITFDGGLSFGMDSAFSTLFGDVADSARGLVAPLNKLQRMLGQLRAAVDKDREQRETQLEIARLQADGATWASNLANSKGAASRTIDSIHSLEKSTGVYLRNGKGDATLKLKSDGTIDYSASHVKYDSNDDISRWRSRFWGKDGLESRIFKYNRDIAARSGKVEELREQVRALGGIPAFASGGVHAGGWRVVGERGWELEHTGPSRVVSHSDSMAMLDNRHVVRAIDSVHRSIDELRQQQAVLAQRQELYAKSTARILETWDVDGQPGERS